MVAPFPIQWQSQIFTTTIFYSVANKTKLNISSSPPKKHEKNNNKALFKEKKVPGKTPLYQRNLEHLITL